MRLVKVLASLLALPLIGLTLENLLQKEGKFSFQHGGSIISVHQRKTACLYQILWSHLVNTAEIFPPH